MIQTTIQKLQIIDVTGYKLYVIKNEGKEVLYVGQSSSIKSRIRQHLSSKTLIGTALSTNRPQSREWEVDLYTVDECMDLIKRYFPYAPQTSQWELGNTTKPLADFAEDALIHDLVPRYNLITNVHSFYPRELHPETKKYLDSQREAKEKAIAEQKRKYEEYQELLRNSTCTICGKHDTWIHCNSGLPCGVLDRVSIYDKGERIVFPFVCHDCNSVINHLDAIQKDEDRVRMIKTAIRKQRKYKSKPSPVAIQMTLNFTIDDNCA